MYRKSPLSIASLVITFLVYVSTIAPVQNTTTVKIVIFLCIISIFMLIEAEFSLSKCMCDITTYYFGWIPSTMGGSVITNLGFSSGDNEQRTDFCTEHRYTGRLTLLSVFCFLLAFSIFFMVDQPSPFNEILIFSLLLFPLLRFVP